ncbi:hypothetical protein [Paraburkholderia sabiae]
MQQLLDIAQAQAEPEIPSNRVADDDGREAATVIFSSSLHSTPAIAST